MRETIGADATDRAAASGEAMHDRLHAAGGKLGAAAIDSNELGAVEG